VAVAFNVPFQVTHHFMRVLLGQREFVIPYS
jgi:hypothetical protein